MRATASAADPGKRQRRGDRDQRRRLFTATIINSPGVRTGPRRVRWSTAVAIRRICMMLSPARRRTVRPSLPPRTGLAATGRRRHGRGNARPYRPQGSTRQPGAEPLEYGAPVTRPGRRLQPTRSRQHRRRRAVLLLREQLAETAANSRNGDERTLAMRIAALCAMVVGATLTGLGPGWAQAPIVVNVGVAQEVELDSSDRGRGRQRRCAPLLLFLLARLTERLAVREQRATESLN